MSEEMRTDPLGVIYILVGRRGEWLVIRPLGVATTREVAPDTWACWDHYKFGPGR